MPTIREHAERYITMRRKLGFKMCKAGHIRSFVAYLERLGMDTVSADAAIAWATEQTRSTRRDTWAHRLMVIRIFARHLKLVDPDIVEVPPDDALPLGKERITPYLFSPAEVQALLEAAGRLRPAFRGLTYQTLFGLLASTGMRAGEACRLDRCDVDLATGVLSIVNSKFGKSRRVPLHPTSVAALAEYAQRRDAQPNTSRCTAFLVSDRGTRLITRHVSRPFGRLVTSLGITAPAGQRRPRPHDLRHTFATATLLDWYRAGEDVQARLPLLSTYLGHVEPRSTYWYLSGSPELMQIAAGRLEASFGGAQ